MKALLATNGSWSAAILRLGLGIVIFPHGLQKLCGWFGGPGFTGSMRFFAGLHVPAWLGLIVILVETFGSLGLLVGFLTRLAAFGILCDMVGAIWLVHGRNGFFMNWSGRQAGEGFEYHLLVITMALAIMLAGAGRWSIDRRFTGRAGTRA